MMRHLTSCTPQLHVEKVYQLFYWKASVGSMPSFSGRMGLEVQ